MLNNKQIILVQTAVRAAGLRDKTGDGRYRFLLSQYTDSNRRSIVSCKQLTNAQLDDVLAICEALGWRYPGKPDTFCRDKVSRNAHCASFAQQQSIRYLAEDVGWNVDQLGGMIGRMTGGRANSVVMISPREAHNIIEAMKNMLGKVAGKSYRNLKDVQTDMEVAKDGKEETSQVG